MILGDKPLISEVVLSHPYCKGSGEINRLKRICMLHCLLLKELTVIALGDDLNSVIISCRLVETVPECLAYDKMS
jgi:hypothetical protein